MIAIRHLYLRSYKHVIPEFIEVYPISCYINQLYKNIYVFSNNNLKTKEHVFKLCLFTAIVHLKNVKGDDFSVLSKYHILYEAK